MKIAVVGIGGVGGYIGAKLIKSDLADIRLFAKKRQKEAIEKEGLKIIDNDDRFIVKADFSPLKKAEVFDAVFLATKSYGLKDACESIKEFIDENSVIITLSNGVGYKERVKEYLQQGIVCDGCVYIVSHKKSDTLIVKNSSLFYLIFGDENVNDKMKKVAEILNKSSLKTKLSEDAKRKCWEKYLFISVFATMSSYFGEPMDVVFKKYPDILNETLLEIKAVANATGIDINEDDLKKVIKQAQNLPKNSKTSMQLDFEKNRKTELESLSGYIVKKANEFQIKAPNMKKMYDALKKRDKQNR